MAQSLGYTLDDYQLEQDWANIISLANQPGASLEQAHIFALCHIFRRPIIIYSVKYVKSFRGENIGFTHFEGVYLPLIWEPKFCFKTPIALGYTKGHFSALVHQEQTNEHVTFVINNNPVNCKNDICNNNNNNINNDLDSNINDKNNNNNNNNNNNKNDENNNASGNTNLNKNDKFNNINIDINKSSGYYTIGGAVSQIESTENQQQIFHLPLSNNEGQLLPIHFLSGSEVFKFILFYHFKTIVDTLNFKQQSYFKLNCSEWKVKETFEFKFCKIKLKSLKTKKSLSFFNLKSLSLK
jgi:hypothetical protein